MLCNRRNEKYTRTTGGSWETTTYIDGIIDYRENSIARYQSVSHIMDDSKRIASLRVGDTFGDSTPALKYNLDDHLGSSNVLVDEYGTLVNFEEYYPFGETSFGSYAKKRYRYCGKERDSESGLYYYGARYYAPWTCRFISVDPLAADYPYLTPYNYAGNKPITHKDIDGLQSTGDQKVNTVQQDNTNVSTSPAPSANNLIPVTTNVYQINDKTGTAEKIDVDGIKGSLSKSDAAKLNKGGNFIYREGKLSPTSEKTISQINDPSKSDSPLAKFALEKLQTDARKFDGKFPNDYYVEFSKAITEKAISLEGADKGVNNTYEMLGVENLPQARAVLQVYESIVPNNQDTHIDKVQHFIASEAKQYNLGKTITDIQQYGKEIFFDAIPSLFSNDRGFDSQDMKANNLGQKYGDQLHAKYHPIRNGLRKLN